MPKTRLIPVAANSGAFTSVASTIAANTVQIVEDDSVSPQQGIQVQFPGDAYATTDTYGPGKPVEIAAQPTGALGIPQQGIPGAFNYTPATPYCQVRSATATGTTIRVVEAE